MNDRDDPSHTGRHRPQRRFHHRGDHSGGRQEEHHGDPRAQDWDREPGPNHDRAGHDRGYRSGRADDDLFRSPNPHRLYRNRKEGKIAGVCAGVADYFNLDAWVVRLAVILGFFFFPPAVILGYIVMVLVLKRRPEGLYESREEEAFWRSVTTRPDQTLSGLRAKFRELDRQIAEMEGFVASREFDLHRQFKDLEKK